MASETLQEADLTEA